MIADLAIYYVSACILYEMLLLQWRSWQSEWKGFFETLEFNHMLFLIVFSPIWRPVCLFYDLFIFLYYFFRALGAKKQE